MNLFFGVSNNPKVNAAKTPDIKPPQKPVS